MQRRMEGGREGGGVVGTNLTSSEIIGIPTRKKKCRKCSERWEGISILLHPRHQAFHYWNTHTEFGHTVLPKSRSFPHTHTLWFVDIWCTSRLYSMCRFEIFPGRLLIPEFHRVSVYRKGFNLAVVEVFLFPDIFKMNTWNENTRKVKVITLISRVSLSQCTTTKLHF